MTRLDRYIATTFLKYLGMLLGIFASLYLLIDILEKFDDFIEHKAAIEMVFRYVFYKLALILIQSLPMAILLATFATIGHFCRTSQMTAMRSSGIGLWQATRPIFIIGALFSVITLIGNQWVVPWSAREANYVLQTEVKGLVAVFYRDYDLYFRDGNRIISIKRSFPQKQELRGVTSFKFNDNFLLTERLDAIKARYQGDGNWELKQVTIRKFNPETQSIKSYKEKDEVLIHLDRAPEELLDLWFQPEEMTLHELRDLIDKSTAEGHDPRRYEAEIHFRIAQAATPFIMVLLGIPFALQRGREANFALGIVISLAICIAYFILQAVFVAFGQAEILPISIAAWAANILLALVGSWMFLRMQN